MADTLTGYVYCPGSNNLALGEIDSSEKTMSSMADRDGLIWFDGEMVDWRDAKIHVLTHTLHYGMGVFEGVRAYKTDQGPAVFRLEDHTKRLFNSAKIMNMDIPFTQEQVNDAQLAVVRDKLTYGQWHFMALRVWVYVQTI